MPARNVTPRANPRKTAPPTAGAPGTQGPSARTGPRTRPERPTLAAQLARGLAAGCFAHDMNNVLASLSLRV